MPETRDCIEYASKNITDDELITRNACELALLIPRAGGNIGYLHVYDGENNQGELKFTLKFPKNNAFPYRFTPHVYFRKGLFIVFVDNVDSCFVQWRMRPSKEG